MALKKKIVPIFKIKKYITCIKVQTDDLDDDLNYTEKEVYVAEVDAFLMLSEGDMICFPGCAEGGNEIISKTYTYGTDIITCTYVVEGVD